MATTSIKARFGEVRFSYLHVFEPWSAEATKLPQYTATLLIPKSNKSLVALIKSKIDEAYNAAITEKWGGKKPAKWFNPLQDGDEPKKDGEDRGEAYADHWYINAKSKQQPGVLRYSPDGNHTLILDSEDFYSGCYGYATVGFSGFTSNGNYGISCYLNNLLLTREGEPLGGARTTAEQDFKDLKIDGYDADNDEL